MTRAVQKLVPKLKKLAGNPDPPLLRELFRTDLFALMYLGLRRRDMAHQWLLERCDEVQDSPDGHLDLWAREHGKTSIISIGKTIQDILCDPEITIGIFSHTRPLAKGIFRPIKYEFESNSLLIDLYPDIFWSNPKRDAPKWSEDDGIIVKRKGNPKEATLEAWGLIDGQPIGKHFNLLYDDIVTPANVASAEMREKTLAALELSYNLGLRGGWRRFVGTRYHYADAYQTVIERKTAAPRIYPATGEDGQPVLLKQEELEEKRRDMGPYTYAAQMELDPKQDGSVGFKPDWWREWKADERVEGNNYIVVDPANDKKKKSDYTTLWVMTAGHDKNWYSRHIVRDRLNLAERIELVMEMHRIWQPKAVGYEQYGMQADIQAIEIEQKRVGYRFDIIPLGGQVSKFDRISGLIPMFEQGNIYIQHRCVVQTRDSGLQDMVAAFRDQEFMAWPYSAHDDMLDALARIMEPDLGVRWPSEVRMQSTVVAQTQWSPWQ
jgi:predicted phage terminase large subunit-like protein